MKIDNEVLSVLARSSTNCNMLYLPEQLDRKLYIKVNRVLEAIGWKWNRSAKAHIVGPSVRDDATAQLESVILTGEVRFHTNELQQFFTPLGIVKELCALAELEPGMLVLEPSAGSGAIAVYAKIFGCNVRCVEIDRELSNELLRHGLPTTTADFLTVAPLPIYDRVLMNPPFTKRQEAFHVLHALQFLKPGGRLVSVMSSGIEFRGMQSDPDRTGGRDAEYRMVRDMVTARGGVIRRLPERSFSLAGAEVHTCLVSIEAVRDNSHATPRVVRTQATPAARPQLKVVPPVPRPEEFTLTPRTY